MLEAFHAWHLIEGRRINDSGDWVKNRNKPIDVIFVHGPIQQKHGMYTKNDQFICQHFCKWLENNFINEEKVRKDISFSKAIPWNTPLVICCFLMKRISNSKIPVIGCVERSSARRLATTVANDISFRAYRIPRK